MSQILISVGAALLIKNLLIRIEYKLAINEPATCVIRQQRGKPPKFFWCDVGNPPAELEKPNNGGSGCRRSIYWHVRGPQLSQLGFERKSLLSPDLLFVRLRAGRQIVPL
jgi:hypothetical protein